MRNVLVSGGGIAGLTLGLALQRRGFAPMVIDREPDLRRAGYMMDFFGTGWDVAERMGLIADIAAVRYPIDALAYVDASGRPWLTVPITRLRHALHDRYSYLRRPDLEAILLAHTRAAGVPVRFGRRISALADTGDAVQVRFDDDSEAAFDLVIGADGVHSAVRRLAFGDDAQFARFLGYYVAAVSLAHARAGVDRAVTLHEETDRLVALYPRDETWIDTMFLFRHRDIGPVPHGERLDLLRAAFAGSRATAARTLDAVDASQPLFFDSLTQIVMPRWSRGRIALVGDACAALTLIAGQGSHMAMAGAYVLADELARTPDDHDTAFARYERALKAQVARKQKDAALFARIFAPTGRSRPWLRRLAIRAIFSRWLLPSLMGQFGRRSVLSGRP